MGGTVSRGVNGAPSAGAVGPKCVLSITPVDPKASIAPVNVGSIHVLVVGAVGSEGGWDSYVKDLDCRLLFQRCEYDFLQIF